jgi:CRISPR-associated endoribonuclease Cas6
MRIQFSLSCQKNTIIPINYQAEVSNWIFEVLASGGAELHAYMKDRGFDLKARTFKLFTFSPLAIYPYEMDQVKQEFKLTGNQVKLGFSIYLDPVFEQQVIHLFRQMPLQLGVVEDKPAMFEIKHWQVQSSPNFKDSMQFKAESPISQTYIEESNLPNPYPTVDSERYDVQFFLSLMQRYKAAHQYKSLASNQLLDPSFPMFFRALGTAKSRLIHLKPNVEGLNQARGFMYEYEVALPAKMMEFAYFGGFGQYPHLGFGFVNVK